MANPQPNDPHGVIAHDIQENILIRDFSKQQLRVIYLVIRLSWGCGVKVWQYESYKDFEVIGLYKGDVAKNLTFLNTNNVVTWNKQYKLLAFNKNYDTWTVAKTFETTDIKKLVSKSLKNTNLVSEILTPLVKNTNAVSETLTKPLVNHERFKAGTSTGNDISDVPKESIKESNNTTTTEEKEVAKISQFFERNSFGLIGESEHTDINVYIDQDKVEPALILIALKTSVDNGVRKWGYAKSCLDTWIKNGITTVCQLETYRKAEKYRKEEVKKSNSIRAPNTYKQSKQSKQPYNIFAEIEKEEGFK
jgi:DnaD/phage-associated family protein